MKYVIIIGDGMADEPIEALNGKSVLEASYNPNMNLLAKRGRIGLMKTCFDDLPVGSIVANMGILGYDPYKYFPNGRASFEALAHGVYLEDDDVCFRCNLISLDKDGNIKDFKANFISDSDALNIINNLFKSVGILKIDPETGKKIYRLLDKEIKEGNTDVFYDIILSRYIDELDIYIKNLNPLKWVEIDTIEDFEKARKILANHCEQCNGFWGAE